MASKLECAAAISMSSFLDGFSAAVPNHQNVDQDLVPNPQEEACLLSFLDGYEANNRQQQNDQQQQSNYQPNPIQMISLRYCNEMIDFLRLNGVFICNSIME